MDAGLSEPLFWGSFILSLILAGIAAFPVNRWLIARGGGQALVRTHHGQPSGLTTSEKEKRKKTVRHTSNHVHH